ncbi:MAG: thioredoxin family protein [Flavobacteriales bacterium]|nr:thioredoxin family protein [Flavobacteriales bacterium]
MKQFLGILLFLVIATLQAQPPSAAGAEEPVKLSVSAARDGDGWDIKVTATIEHGWSVYSMNNYGDMGPWPTSIRVDSVAGLALVGKAAETGPKIIEGVDEIFGMFVKKFKDQAVFTQRITVSDPATPVTGAFEYMTCNDEMCLPPATVYFIVPGLTSGQFELGAIPFDPNDTRFQGLATRSGSAELKLANVDLASPVIKGGEATVAETKSLWSIFFLGFIGGLVALLTPCVFPMIPLTVSFFTKGSEDKKKGLRNALTYGGFILGIYLLFSLPFHLLGSVNPEIFNEISTNPWLNIFFFVIFLVFAVSFFGYFEITLPSSWVNSMDQKASKFGGMIGIFFMALTLALVSFSCTGPILGSLLAGALTADGGAWQLTAGLGGFGMALALPFALFALFPSWLNSLPRSGSWLNSVKVVLGFAEIALAFKFLSNADLVKQWSIVSYELFMVVWVLCALGIVLYLFGLIRFPHDSPVKNRSTVRWAFIALFTITTGYLAFGLRVDKEQKTFRPVALMSGLAPPAGYSWVLPKKAEAFHDLNEAMEHARSVNKPVMVDFTGWACVNCRKMEEHVWPEQGVKEIIENDYVLVSLYVDDKRELPKEQQFIHETSTGAKKPIITHGNKWATLQAENFASASQPLYVLLSPEGKLLTDPVGYTPDKEEYAGFLRRGLDAMRVLTAQASL